MVPASLSLGRLERHGLTTRYRVSFPTLQAGLKGVLGHLSDEALSNGIELSIMVDGNVPPGGGLSSSAAMVVSSAIAVLQAYDYISQTTQGQLAEIAITSGMCKYCADLQEHH